MQKTKGASITKKYKINEFFWLKISFLMNNCLILSRMVK